MGAGEQRVHTTGATRHGDFMLTSTGLQFWPLDPRPEEVNYFDIAARLSNQCRYNGQTHRFYSIAEHSVLLAHYFLRRHELAFARWALMHDAAEAYIGDMIRPLKPFVPAFLEIEARLERVIWTKYGLEGDLPPEVKAADTAILGDEMCRLFPLAAVNGVGIGRWPKLGVLLALWSPNEASDRFCRLMKDLF
jgi:hypothetical protein